MKLLSEGQEDVGSALNVSCKQYLRMLVPADQEEAAVVPQQPAHVVSLNALKQLPLAEQCRLLMKDGMKNSDLKKRNVTNSFCFSCSKNLTVPTANDSVKWWGRCFR